MDKSLLSDALKIYKTDKAVRGKGALSVVIYITRFAIENSLPIDPNAMITGSSGQVLGLNKAAVQRVLNDHGITTVLAEEGGRTSRGSIRGMTSYVAFLNALEDIDVSDLKFIEAWWIERVKEHFASKPLKLRFDESKGFQNIIQDLLQQAKKRQQEATGTMYQGAVLQHLVGAKLELALPGLTINHNGFSVADAVSDRSGDFVIGNSIIHITTSPSEAVIRKCQSNIEAGCKPIILTLADGVTTARVLANNIGLTGRIDILDAEQFLAANLHEISLFDVSARRTTLDSLVMTYNKIVDDNETDPSLKIQLNNEPF